MYNFLQKICWAAFWAIFSETHPVTLPSSFIRSHEKYGSGRNVAEIRRTTWAEKIKGFARRGVVWWCRLCQHGFELMGRGIESSQGGRL
jgi:hypothetical protein